MRPSRDARRSWSFVSLVVLGIVLCAAVLANPMPVGAQAGIPGSGHSAPFEDLRLKN